MKKNKVLRRARLWVPVALMLVYLTMLLPAWANAAGPSQAEMQVWTIAEAEIARQAAEGMLLRDIINGAVKSGDRIHVVVAEAVKVGIDPSQVVRTSITEGYAARTVVTAAVKAGAPLGVVLRAAAGAGADNATLNIKELITLTIKRGSDPGPVVAAAITEGFPAQTVVSAALKVGAPLPVVVNAAVDAGADEKSIYVGAADAGESPRAVERSIAIATNPLMRESFAGTPSPLIETRPFLATHPAPAIFGRGGVILTPIPVLSPALSPLNIHQRNLKASLSLSVSQTFSDNITFVPDDIKISDSITTITPGLRLQLPFGAHAAEFGYHSVIARYGKNDSENITDHHVGGSVGLKASDRIDLRLSDNLDRGHEPRSSTPTGTNEIFHSNVAAVSAVYRPMDDLRAQLDLGLSNWRFITSHFRDREESRIAGTVFYQAFFETSVFIEYELKNMAYSQDTSDLDSRISTVQAGLTWDLSARSKGTLKAGLAQKDPESSGRTGGTMKVGSADVRHNLSNDTTIVLTAQRSMNEPNIPGSEYFISTGAYAELTQRFIKKWALVLRGAFVQDNNEARTDKTGLAGAGLKYQALDWLGIALDYNLRKQHSSSPANTYTEHSSIILVNISL